MKALFKIILVSVVFILSTINVTAHSGKTDSYGGHYDNSTGEYHYHHGYSAHSHYDIDGDGVIDCPYEFDDKTNHNNHNSSHKTNNSTSVSVHNSEISQNKITFKDVVRAVLLIIPLSLVTLYFLFLLAGIINIIIAWLAENCFQITIEDSIQQRILRIMLIIGLVIILPLEVLWLLGIL